ncbi:MAG: hypothetical protein ACRD4E_07475 [Bryobacteraceae bacterium]
MPRSALGLGMAGVRPKKELRSQVEVIKGLVEGSTWSLRNMVLLLRPSMLGLSRL